MKGGHKQLSLEGFDFSKEKNLTKIEIENFSSKFLNNLIDPKKRDIFKIGSINIGQKNSSFEGSNNSTKYSSTFFGRFSLVGCSCL